MFLLFSMVGKNKRVPQSSMVSWFFVCESGCRDRDFCANNSMVACETQVVPWEVYGKIRSTDLGENRVTLVTIHPVGRMLFVAVHEPVSESSGAFDQKLKTRSLASQPCRKKTLPAGLVKYDQIQIWWWKIRKSIRAHIILP